jgi:hypothetical protein
MAGVHPEVHVDGAPHVPYPLAGDICLGQLGLLDLQHRAQFVEQRYNFACGELTSRFVFHGDGVEARVEVLTFCSRSQPTLVLQETRVEVSEPCELA